MLNIEFYSLQTRLNSSYPSKTNTQDILDYFADKEWIEVDTETYGFDPYTKKLYCIQLGSRDKQFVIDLTTIDIKLFKYLLENKKLILQNAKFDLRFLYHNDIYPFQVYDTYLAEVKLNQGIKNVRKNLQVLEERYCDTNYVDKNDRGLIHKEGFTDRVIRYCAGDVAVLHVIKDKQEIKAKELGLTEAIRLENEFVLALAYTEYCGLFIDKSLWLKKVEKSTEILIQSEKNLNQYILDNNMSAYIDPQLDLFSTERTVNINWNSDKQVKPLFKDLGINVTVKEKGETKESVESTVLLPQVKDFPILPLYLEYKKYEKDVSTYGEKFLRHINPISGRVHTSYTQVVDTGRMASGGKQGKVETPNLQNIPAIPEKDNRVPGMVYARECVTAQNKDNILINADYTGQEQILLVNKSKDKDLIAFYNADLGDMHSYIASKIYPELKDLSLKDIKRLHKGKRQIAKAAGFALNYGGTGYTVSNNLGIPIGEGNEVERAYFEAFPGLKDYYDSCEKDALDKGYILIDSLLGSKFFIDKFDEFKVLEKKYNFDNKEFWLKYREEKKKNSQWYLYEKEDVSYYFRWKGAIRRMALNFPIQGSSASVTKLASVYFFRWIKENNLLRKVLITNIVHDELMTEQPKTISQLVAGKLKECMENAGKHYCPIIPLKAEPVLTEYWAH